MTTYRLLDKKPSETVKGLWIDFKRHLLDGEIASGATVTGSVTGVAQNAQPAGTKVTWDATGGTDGDDVIFTVTATGSMGSIRVETAVMAIKA